MDGLDYYESNNTNCRNVYYPNEFLYQFQVYRIIGIIGIVLLVPTLILQLIYIYRSKSTFLYRQFLYTTIVLILVGIINILYPSSFCSFLFSQILYIINLYLLYVEILQITAIYLHLLYKFSKHIETRMMQRLQTLCCKLCKNMETRPIQRLQTLCCNTRLWYDVMIVCIQLGLPLPIY